jgi:hypothetical protein|uniref:Uncharacterized protein n=1 Tax=candidate division WOR-3 bacterium TaxID=2052148 RepID=A0A7C3URB5_UNCW3
MGKRIIPLILIISILALIYLPGPNGLISLIRREREKKRLQAEIFDLRVKNILLRSKRERVSSLKYWQEMVRKKLERKKGGG